MNEPHAFKLIAWVGSSHDFIYVLHVFQKKSKKGISTPKAVLDLIKKRLKLAEEHHKKHQWGNGKMTTKRKRMKATKKIKEEIWVGSGNVFADLGLADAEELLLKAKLTSQIAQLIEKKGLTQVQAAERMGLDQPKVSRLLRGKLSGFSADRLITILNRLGHSVEVRISAKERPPEKSHTRVMIG